MYCCIAGRARSTRGLDKSVSKLRSELKIAEEAVATSNRRCKEAQSQMNALEAKVSEAAKMRRHTVEEGRKNVAELQHRCDQMGQSNEAASVRLDFEVEEKKRLGRAVAELSCELEQKELELQQEQGDCKVQSELAANSKQQADKLAAEKKQLQSQLEEMSGTYETLFHQIQLEQSTASEVASAAERIHE